MLYSQIKEIYDIIYVPPSPSSSSSITFSQREIQQPKKSKDLQQGEKTKTLK